MGGGVLVGDEAGVGVDVAIGRGVKSGVGVSGFGVDVGRGVAVGVGPEAGRVAVAVGGTGTEVAVAAGPEVGVDVAAGLVVGVDVAWLPDDPASVVAVAVGSSSSPPPQAMANTANAVTSAPRASRRLILKICNLCPSNSVPVYRMYNHPIDQNQNFCTRES